MVLEADPITFAMSRACIDAPYSSRDTTRGSARVWESSWASTASRWRGGSAYVAQLVTATVEPAATGAVVGSTLAAAQTANHAGPSRRASSAEGGRSRHTRRASSCSAFGWKTAAVTASHATKAMTYKVPLERPTNCAASQDLLCTRAWNV